MLCAIYKSPRKAQTYLFVKKRDDFSAVSEGLMQTFGTPMFVMLINLATKKKLAMADIDKVKENLNERGFYLQLPPPQEDLLKEHKAVMVANKDQGELL
ncbi:MAG: YcgL domain-containing protein [Colwellia sp.]